MRCTFLLGVVASVALGSLALAQEKPKPPPAPPAPSNTGTLSEEEFAKLHQLKPEEAPPAKGTMVDLADGSKAYLALPKDWKPGGAAIVVIHEWWGLNSHIKHWADRFTETGRAALAVDLYGGKTATSAPDAGKMMQAVDEKKAVATLLAGHAFLKDDARVKAGKRGSIGWCFGGGMSLQLALAAPDLDAAVMYYGKPVTDAEQLKKIKAPLLGVFGDKDKAFNPELVKKFDDALTAAGTKHAIHHFDANHAFANPSNPNYDATSAAAAWEKVQAFLDENLKVAAK